MDNLREVLQGQFNYNPEEVEAIMDKIEEEMCYNGRTEVGALVEVFGEGVSTILKVLGDTSDA